MRRVREPLVFTAVASFLVAVAFATFMIRPFRAGTLGYDAAASVLYFDRIAAGRQLEAFVGATPKPLLTLVYGIVHAVIPDWRAISWIAIAVYGGGIATMGALAFRLGGAIAAAFVSAGLLASPELLQDVDLAYAVSWALLLWGIAGLLVTNARPRYGWAGIALALAGTARLETMIVMALAGLVLLLRFLNVKRTGASSASVRARVPILLGVLALPVQMLHDVVLTGDPLYSQSVPVIGSIGLALPGMLGVLRQLGTHFASEPALLLLGVVGLLVLLRRRQWEIAAAIMGLFFGVLAFLAYLAARGVFVSNRYVAPADIALTFAAGIGAAWILGPSIAIAAARIGRWPRARIALPSIVGVVVAIALIRSIGPLDRPTQAAIAANGAVHRDLLRVTPVIQGAVTARGGPEWPLDASPTRPMGERAIVLVPTLTLPQLAVDLRLPLSAIGWTDGRKIAADGTYPRPGQIVFHDIDRDEPRAPFRLFEISAVSRVGNIQIAPILVDQAGRFWVVEIEP